MDNNHSLYERTYREQSIKYDPLVSIITPVLNGVQYLKPCIESVLNQSYPHIEHVIIDGVSNDGTVDILSIYATKYPDQVRFISEPDEGPWDAANKGICMAKGQILGVIGADDMYEPDAIQAVVDFFKANQGAHLVFGDCNIISQEGELIGRSRVKDFNLNEMINGTLGGPGTATFYSREIFKKLGLFNGLACDLDFVIKVGRVFSIYRIDKVLCNSRVNKGSLTYGSWNRRKMLVREHCRVSRRHGGSIFSGYCMIYYAYVLLDWFRPVFSPIYPFIGRLTGKNIGKAQDDWVVRIKG